jgi:type IX secretion system PorP/SprF family membrane protein
MKSLKLTMIALCLSIFAKAQQPISYNLYPQNSFLLNPAVMVEDNCFNAFINRQSKWSDVNGLTANTFGAHGRIAKNSYLGGMIVGDKRALVNYFIGDLMYAHKIQFKQDNFLSLALTVGLANNSLNDEMANLQTKNDPAFQVFNSTRFDAGFGAAYYLKQWKLGASIPHFFDQFGDFSNQYNASLGYNFKTKNHVWDFNPSIMARNYRSVGLLYDVNALATWNEKVTGQLGYRTDKSIIAGIGLNWKMLKIAYAYQYHVGSNYNAFSPGGTQEIQLAIRLCKKDKPMVKEEVKPVVDPNADKVGVSVNMSDEKYGNPVMGNITIMKGKTVLYSGQGDASGISNFYLPPGVYKMSVGAKGYIPVEETIDISQNEKGSKYEVKLKQPKIEKGLVFKLSAINFETGSERLTSSSFDILDKMADILKENPNMIVEVSGHTDNVGDDQKNMALSQNRANSVMNYLLKKGVSAGQLKAVGYGETQPVSENDTVEGRKKNRRVMFTVVEF